MALVLGVVEGQHARAEYGRSGESGIVDGEPVGVAHGFDRQVSSGDQPGPEGRQPRHRFPGLERGQGRAWVGHEPVDGDAGTDREASRPIRNGATVDHGAESRVTAVLRARRHRGAPAVRSPRGRRVAWPIRSPRCRAPSRPRHRCCGPGHLDRFDRAGGGCVVEGAAAAARSGVDVGSRLVEGADRIGGIGDGGDVQWGQAAGRCQGLVVW